MEREEIVLRSERDAVDLIHGIMEVRERLSELRRVDEALTKALKQYLEEHGLTSLADDERGITARLQERRGGVAYDTRAMPDDLVIRLRDLGALSIDTKVIDALEGKSVEAADVKRYAYQKGGSTALVFERGAGVRGRR